MSDMKLKNSIIDAISSAIQNAEHQSQPSEYDKGKIAGLKKAMTLIHMVTNPRIKDATPIDIVIDDLPPYTEMHNKT
ncbi:hypothetical protein KDC22_11525 [Paenibacillus tritici]|uniref:hypothetical protein n=1 Tax=Paenibacillus tritici TaxID=1873425 RepID=UPI001BA5D90D|nr:hypothetical protein [Paenibacillus tritici]QUL57041.1 hypothetical protein KDC22_11525 [Paenibacillus tritici]